jgi:hypothetical protein
MMRRQADERPDEPFVAELTGKSGRHASTLFEGRESAYRVS